MNESDTLLPEVQSDIQRFPGVQAVQDYIQKYRREGLPPFDFGGPLDLFPSETAEQPFRASLTWENPWPYAERSGVYLIYSESLELLYVGKADVLGKRLYCHFGGGDACVVKGDFWTHRPRFVITVAVPVDTPFEAASLEAYLIRLLQPVGNILGR